MEIGEILKQWIVKEGRGTGDVAVFVLVGKTMRSAEWIARPGAKFLLDLEERRVAETARAMVGECYAHERTRRVNARGD